MNNAIPLAYEPVVDPLISPTLAAAEMGISIDTLRRAWRAGEIEVIKISKRRLGMRRSEMKRYLSERVIRHAKE